MVYESFNNSKNKLQKSWERSEDNENNLKDIPLVELNFNSINFNKKIVTIPIVTDKLFDRSLSSPISDRVHTILLQNFPEWAINMIEVHCVYTLGDAFLNFPIESTPTSGNLPSNERNGQIVIQTQEFDYWFNNIDEINYDLKIFLNILIRQFTKDGFPFGNIIPPNITLSLKINNQRIYETMNSHKE